MFLECPMCSHVTCDPCPFPQVPRGPCFPWSPLAPPLLHGLVSTATQVLLSEAHGTGGGSRIAISNNVPSARWPQLGGGGRAAPPAPCLWEGLSANSACWVASCLPWACMGMLQRCPLSWRPSVPSAATALLLLVTQPVLVQDLEGHSQDSTPFPCLLGELSSGQASSSQPAGWETYCGEAQRPAGRIPPDFQQAPWSHRASPRIWPIFTEHRCAGACSRHRRHRVNKASWS